jgi:hypothetical protein
MDLGDAAIAAAMRALDVQVGLLLRGKTVSGLTPQQRDLLIRYAEDGIRARRVSRRAIERLMAQRIAAINIAGMLAVLDGVEAPCPFADPELVKVFVAEQDFGRKLRAERAGQPTDSNLPLAFVR